MSRPSATEDVFRAVADPTRRAVLEALLHARELPVTELADRLGVGVPMLSRHLAVLRAAGLVDERRSGRHRLYSLRPQPLRDLFDWASLFSDFWSDIQGLRAYLDRRSEHTEPGTTATDPPHATGKSGNAP
ncbi:ArsR/SmtB family transcription factor [Actinomadura sp. HBU206391]|uniref:ArsR/SmtB family transcription factor n=1 Tax=Actinomadura sp. HBU206391 TaxID=2731692 RepID=UPI001650645D|nr:metalloregulator ArsR/SmtB family transcription factor [Actinomadura sp. HBU206391]MBC6463628.1 helix-turn-helix transcriptional regulator [Actinomadura sp. HBU206391]